MDNNKILSPVFVEILDFEEYLETYKANKDNIESTEIVPPQLDENNFGGIKIRYKNPIYKRILFSEWLTPKIIQD